MGDELAGPPRADRTLEVPTDIGPGRLWINAGDERRAVLLLGHGAGAGVDTPDLAGLARDLPARGIAVVRFEQPWRIAGRRLAGSPATLDLAWREAVAMTVGLAGGLPLFVGGRSAGARVACRGFAPPARGIVALSFPLHPPGKPGTSRIAELAPVAADTLVVQGARDPFGTPAEIADALAAAGTAPAGLVALAGVAHGLNARGRTAGERLPGVVAEVVDHVAAFVLARL